MCVTYRSIVYFNQCQMITFQSFHKLSIDTLQCDQLLFLLCQLEGQVLYKCLHLVVLLVFRGENGLVSLVIIEQQLKVVVLFDL